MTDYTIEARSLSVAGVASHNFLVLKDETGKPLAELHGLATDRQTGKAIPIGTDEQKHSLRIWHYPHDPQIAERYDVRETRSTYVKEGQDSVVVLKADKAEILARWDAAVAAKEPLNALDLNYPSDGVNLFRPTVNSNSSYRTLSEIMGLPVHDFPGKLEPGLDQRMVDPKTIENMRTHGYPVLDAPARKENGKYEPLPAQGKRAGQDDARSADHPGHAEYAAIRGGLAQALGEDGGRLENASASLYLKTASDPLLPRIDHAGVYSGHAVATYAPHGLGREPMFNAAVPLSQAERESAERTLSQANAVLTQAQQRQAEAPQRLAPEQAGPSLSIGARTA